MLSRARALAASGVRGTGELAWKVGFDAYVALTCCWLLIGACAQIVAASADLRRALERVADASGGTSWSGRAAAGLLAGAEHSFPLSDAVLDYAFSALNLAIAALLYRLARTNRTVRLLVVGMVGSAGAFNLETHTTIDVVQTATGWDVGMWHLALLHGVGGVAYVFALLVFPTGRLDWGGRGGCLPRSVVLLSVAGGVGLLAASTAEYPHTISFVLFFGLLTPVAGITAQLVRARRAEDAETLQQSRVLLWALLLAFGVAVVLSCATLLTGALQSTAPAAGDPRTASAPVSPLPGMAGHLPGLGGLGTQKGVFWVFRAVFATIPLAIIAGVLRFRLWDVERFFNRALVYSVLVAVTGVLYVGLVIGADTVLGLPMGMTGLPQIAAGGIVALCFEPLRAWAERVGERLVWGARRTPYELLGEVSALAQNTLAGAGALESLAQLTAEGMGARAAAVRLALPGGSGACRDYRWPPDGTTHPEDSDGVRMPVRYSGRMLGSLWVSGLPADRTGRERSALLADLASGAGLLLHHAQLTLELQERLTAISKASVELRDSRRRVVAVQDDERRALERNLHDGAQQHLIALRLTSGLLEHLVRTGNLPAARAALDRFHDQITAARCDLERTVRGLHPAALVGSGLAAALREQADLFDARITLLLDLPEGRRFAPAVEAAVCFCCMEALQNAVKHCPGAEITLSLTSRSGTLRFAVVDDGPGFDPDSAQNGCGMRNLRERVAAVDGALRLSSRPGQGTRIEGQVPIGGETGPLSLQRRGTGGSAARVRVLA
ncbi:sensor histidine kinase [Streptomyces sp.]|uniref:sensor histidine kinase n=1 Tax=Streptomyces sp. TaxID=1931 RepID=UPI002F3F5C09